ncbi:MAG: hypothetical protein IJ672_03095 [Methanobrevibacter sp.]|uniref:hypothetical protein n=1 Tax=Methanobrevibacter sp. TaxID=66852 RepID=UPI0025E60692|nr:hypothetical protein [Methanobrevibacter sp.]MBQ8017401.1 hypothetical protein [Methanobrevibacter sp.]MBR1610463.1 hypothetical protein [Methanobrevibacter sp.]
MVKLCPKCGANLTEVIGGYLCHECGGGMFSEDEVICPRCPTCGSELGDLMNEYYCYECGRSVSKDSADSNDDSYFKEPDYDSMVNNGDNICLNCTYWSVSPYGASHGMVCRRGYPTDGPGDSCSDFVQSHHFANYGDAGQYQFDETSRNISNKLSHWRNNR